MSIEKLEELRKEYQQYCSAEDWEASISNFMIEVVNTFKDQSDQIADLRQGFSKKEELK